MTQTEHVLAEEEQMSAARTKHQEETYRECIPTVHFFLFFHPIYYLRPSILSPSY